MESRPKVLGILGKTGTGKSTLSNVLTGHSPDADVFEVSPETSGCTQQTKIAKFNYLGDAEKPLTVIDTVGFDDPSKNHDADIIAELVTKLKNDCDFVNMILIAQNGTNPRLDGSLLAMMKIFEAMFTKKIWGHIGIVFTKMSMDKKSVKKRGKGDKAFARDYVKSVKTMFNLPGDVDIPCFFIDAKYDEDDEDELDVFETETEKLWDLVLQKPELSTDEVTRVQTENEKLNQQIQDEQAAREEADRAAEEARQQAAKEEEARVAAERKAQQEEENAKIAKEARERAEAEADVHKRDADTHKEKAEMEVLARKKANLEAEAHKSEAEKAKAIADEAMIKAKAAVDKMENLQIVGKVVETAGKVVETVSNAYVAVRSLQKALH